MTKKEKREVIEILMTRDGISYESAKKLVESALSEALIHIEEGDIEAAEEIWMSDTELKRKFT